MRMRLRMVIEVDFRTGVPTHLELLKRRLPELGHDEVVCLVSKTGTSLAFAFRKSEVAGMTAVTHVRVQLDHRRPWNPLLLAEYAKRAGISLDGLRTFEQWWKERQS